MGDPLRRKAASDKTTQCAHQNFGAVADKLRAGGFVPIPLEGKVPLPRNWSRFWNNSPQAKTYESWNKRNAKSNIGLCLGEVVGDDIDIDDKPVADAVQQIVFEVLGPSAFIRVGREPRRTIFYRLSLEDAMQAVIWSVGKVDFLAAGKQSAVFGIHPDTGKPFHWPQKSILGVSVKDIPATTIERIHALRAKLQDTEGVPLEEEPATRFSMDYSPKVGERDKYLFWYAKEMAATLSTEADLLAAVLKKNAQFDEPLSGSQAKEKVRSAWKYKLAGDLRLSGASAPIVIPIARTVMADHMKELDAQSCKLLVGLASTRHNQKEFTIPQLATAQAFNMSPGSLRKGLKQLIMFGILIDTGLTKRVSLQPRAAKLYRFGDGSPPRPRVSALSRYVARSTMSDLL